MLIRRRRGWEIPEREATPESVYFGRRALLTGAGAFALAGGLASSAAHAAGPVPPYPAKRNPRYVLDRDLTPQSLSTSYNNFYEFGTDKDIVAPAQALKPRPWTVKIDGLVDKEQVLGIDDLLNKVTLEERLYRHRCVETWSMAVPWTGFPMKALVDLARPLSGAKYVRMETFLNPDVAPGQGDSFESWPYVEGLTIAEAVNELSFLVTGMYGAPLLAQNGTPLRLAVPWKYGFKSVKSIVRFSFVADRPQSFWEQLQSAEYGFWANVNPDVPHPRWSQATELELGTLTRRPTLIWNGYGDFVSAMYSGLAGENLFR